MGQVTIQVIEGFEKGRVLSELTTPVTIGREEDNTIQLNDERVSRFHAKIQEDGGRYILTDLDSTNGTRVNGHPVQLRIMQVGDLVALGRSVLLFGSPAQIEERGRQLVEQPQFAAPVGPPNQTVSLGAGGLLDPPEPLFPGGPPDLPDSLRPVQTAQVSDLLSYFHEQVATIIESGRENMNSRAPEMRADYATWQRLLHLEMELARYLRKIALPGE